MLSFSISKSTALCALLLIPFGKAAYLPGRASSTGADTILLPAVHPSQNILDVDNLKKSISAKLFYNQHPTYKNSSGDIPVATVVIPSLAYPVVQLENSIHIASFSCSSSSAKITFSNIHAFDTALSDWHGEENFVLITYDPSCGDGHAKNERNFILVSSVSSNRASLSITAKIKHISLAEAAGGENVIHVEMGSYTPSAPNMQNGNRLKTSRSLLSHAFSHTFSHPITKTESFNAIASNTETQWGSAYTIFQSKHLSTYCVGCGVSGTIKIQGFFSLTPSQGLKFGKFQIGGKLHCGMQFGLVVKDLSEPITVPDILIINKPLSPFYIPGVADIGPQISIFAGTNVSGHGTESLLIGTTMDWPLIEAKLDTSAPLKSTASGLIPTIPPLFQNLGDTSITASSLLPFRFEGHLQIRFEIGITVLRGLYRETLALVDTPSISTTLSAGDNCEVSFLREIGNRLDFEMPGKQTSINSWTTPPNDVCLRKADDTSATSKG